MDSPLLSAARGPGRCNAAPAPLREREDKPALFCTYELLLFTVFMIFLIRLFVFFDELAVNLAFCDSAVAGGGFAGFVFAEPEIFHVIFGVLPRRHAAPELTSRLPSLYDKDEFPPRLDRFKAGYGAVDVAAPDFFVQFGKLAADGDFAIAESFLKVPKL